MSEVGALRDPSFLRSVRPLLETYASWFRPDVNGLDRLPDRGPFLVVGNHSGGQMSPDLPVLLTAWWRERGEEEPVYALVHSLFMGIPGVGSTLARGGGLVAEAEASEAILAQGGIVIVYPGGDHDVYRPWGERNTIDFDGRMGWIRLALRQQVPVAPVVSIGGQETLVVLTRGEGLARRLGLDRMFRVKVLPLIMGPPFGVVPGGIPTFPLPSKITVEVLDPFDWTDRHGPDAAEDPEVLAACYEEVTTAMQAKLDELAAARRFPVIG